MEIYTGIPLFSDFWTYLVATSVNVLLELMKGRSPVGFVIQRLIHRTAEELCDLPYVKAAAQEKSVSVCPKQTASDLTGKSFFGSTIGILERQIYVYAFIVGIGPIISGVVTLKAFSAWVQRPDPKDQNNAPSAEYPGSALPFLPPRTTDLSRWYSYIIGNLVSFVFAVVLFHLGRLTVPLGAKVIWFWPH